jgi:hypothetical protein
LDGRDTERIEFILVFLVPRVIGQVGMTILQGRFNAFAGHLNGDVIDQRGDFQLLGIGGGLKCTSTSGNPTR